MRIHENKNETGGVMYRGRQKTMGFVILSVFFSIGFCAEFFEQSNTDDSQPRIVEVKNVGVRFEHIENKTGEFVGFRCEVINLYQDRHIALVVPSRELETGRVDLLDAQGAILTPFPKFQMKIGGRKGYILIPPRTGHVFFLNLPAEIFTSPTRNDDVIPLSAGHYKARATAFVAYQLLEKGAELEEIPRYGELESFHVTSQDCLVHIGPSSLLQDVFNVYVRDQ